MMQPGDKDKPEKQPLYFKTLDMNARFANNISYYNQRNLYGNAQACCCLKRDGCCGRSAALRGPGPAYAGNGVHVHVSGRASDGFPSAVPHHGGPAISRQAGQSQTCLESTPTSGLFGCLNR
jgi:hypothetical protein